MKKPLAWKYVVGAVILLAAFALTFYFANRYFEPYLANLTQLITEKFGFWGLALLVFVSDSVVSPLPPDLVLVVIAKSSLREMWWFYVSVLGILSMLGGHLGWFLGKQLGRFPFFKKIAQKPQERSELLLKKYGKWAVVLGAATPVPFSITCWTAGFLHMKWVDFAWAALFRIPRFVIYYLAIHLIG